VTRIISRPSGEVLREWGGIFSFQVFGGKYQVEPGDNLWWIAKRHGSSVGAIFEANRDQIRDLCQLATLATSTEGRDSSFRLSSC